MEISRREFVSWGVAATVALGANGLARAVPGHAARTSSRMDVPVLSVCRACPAGCGIIGYLRDGKRLVAIAGNPDHPTSRGKICALALASINFQTHPERLRVPRRADGGEVALEDALDEAGAMIARHLAAGVKVVVDTWDERPAHAAFLGALKGAGRIIGREALAGEARARVMERVWGVEVRPDLERVDLLLVFGANPFEGGPRFVPDARPIVEARVGRGMRLVVFDPRLSNTGGRADLWVPIRPGTDRVAALALARFSLEHMETSAGALTVKGGSLPLARLAKALEAFDLARAGRVCGVEPRLLEEAAKAFLSARTPATLVGGGVFGRPRPLEAYRAIALLDLLRGPSLLALQPRPRFVPREVALSAAEAEETYASLEGKDGAPVLLVSHRANPVYERGQAMEQALRSGRIAYHVAITPMPNETAALAHLTIPEALPIESGGRVWLAAHGPAASYIEQRPLVAPPEGVPTADQIFLGLARRLGSGGEVGMDADFEEARAQAGAVRFVETTQGIWTTQGADAPAPAFQADLGAREWMSPPEEMAENRDRIEILLHGSSIGSRESAPAKWLAEIAHAAPLFLNPADARWLRVRDGDRVRLVRGEGAAPAAGAVEGPKDAGTPSTSATATVLVSNGVRPGCACMAEGHGHAGSGKLARAEPFRSPTDPDTRLLWWEEEGNGVNLSPWLGCSVDGESGAVVARAPAVKLEVG